MTRKHKPPPVFKPKPRAEFIARRLGGWANQQVCRFGEGTHVYLVGSVLTSDTPRDIDIRIVVPDNLFWRRYRDHADVERLARTVAGARKDACNVPSHPNCAGPCPVEDWNVHGEWTPDMLRFGRESANLAMKLFNAWANIIGVHGTHGRGFPIDLQVTALSEQENRHKDQPRIRIDTIPAGGEGR